ncbi:MAG: NAD-dependent epimerase/dehydratase family protein [Melioribacter sp.]|uniref:NAD-dependent epimerase/dehydratase family protein n=1 Tax=Melioribacter sp. TaxID=2052167 RepID=UPI003BD55EFE
MNKKKIVITGGAGFIGSHIAEAWLEKGAEVHIIDNLRTGFLSNIEKLDGIIFHNGSITDKELVFEATKGADYLHHLAAVISVPESIENPEECIDINVGGLINILEAAKVNKIKKVVFSSSAAVYGDNPELPKSIHSPVFPKSTYGITKLDGEFYLKMYHEQFGVNGIALRYFNVFGARQNPASQYAAAVPIFITKALKNEDITVFGDGNQTRDFIYVKDVVKANILAAESEIEQGIYNVATGVSITINDLARMIVDITGSNSKIVHLEERPGDIKHSAASISETITELGFAPDIPLKTALEETISSYKSNGTKE